MPIAGGCGDDEAVPIEPPGPTTGEVRVSLVMSGFDGDADGATVSVDQGPPQHLDLGEWVAFPDVSEGEHLVEIGDIAGNCEVQGGRSRRVTVAAGEITRETFEAECDWRTRIAFTRLLSGSPPTGDYEIYVMNPDGSGQINVTNDPAPDRDPSWSPDGQRIVFVSDRTGDGDVYVVKRDGSGLMRLTATDEREYEPSWSPDGRRIVFYRDDPNTGGIVVMNADGTGESYLTSELEASIHPRWSPDGSQLVYIDAGRWDVWVMDSDGSNKTRVTNDDSGIDLRPEWSPTGEWLAFQRWQSGEENYEIFIVRPDGTGLFNLSADPSSNDSQPAWSPDGTRLAYERSVGGGGGVRIRVAGLDGSDATDLTGLYVDEFPSWSMDGETIAFERYHPVPGVEHIFAVGATGGEIPIVQLTFATEDSTEPVWSPDPY